MMQQRLDRLVASLPEGFEAALVTTPDNRFYLLDFDSHDAGTLLVFPDSLVFIIDSRYIEAAEAAVSHAGVVLEADGPAQVAEQLKARGVQTLLVEDGITVASLRRWESRLPGVWLDAGPALSAALEGMRQIKDEQEVARIEAAQRITDACYSHILPFIKEGVREIDLALDMEHYMRSHGADGLAFDTIVVAGPNSSRPHGVPGEYRLQPGDFITMDFGAKYKGYCSDMTRTVALGEPSAEQRRVYETVLKAHLAGIDAARPGVPGCQVDAVARDIIDHAGYKGRFGHGLGHSLGVNVHENPRFSPLEKNEIRSGMLMTVEPGVYLPGRFGVRIEDTVLITENGCRPLPAAPKELTVL